MESKVKIFGHPVHPMLVAFPIAFYVATFALYLTYQSNGDVFWFRYGVVANIAGVVMGALAAIPGLIDWFTAIPADSHAKRTGLIHMALNSLTLILFAVAAISNYNKWIESYPNLNATLLLTGIGVLCTVAAGFYGWTLVQKYHVGVDLTYDQKVIEPNQRQKVFETGKTHAIPVRKR